MRRRPSRSRRKSATSFSGSSSSFQVRISAGTFRLSSTDGPFEEGRDDDRVALRRNDRRRQPLGPPPLDAGEIIEARTRLDDDRADAVLCISYRALASRCSRSARPIGGGSWIAALVRGLGNARAADRQRSPPQARRRALRNVRRRICSRPWSPLLRSAPLLHGQAQSASRRPPCSNRLPTTA